MTGSRKEERGKGKEERGKRKEEAVACVASVSARVCRESWEESKKKGVTGEGEGKEGNACPQTPGFSKTKFAHERSF